MSVAGPEARDLSMLYFLAYLRAGEGLMHLVEIEGGAQERRFVGGAQSLSKGLALMLGARVVLHAPVRAIVQSADGVVVRSDAGEVPCKRVIVAIPPALAGRIDYAPLLPALRDQLTQRFPMGATAKVFAVYRRAFWREQGFSGEVVADRGPASVVFDNTGKDGEHPSLLGFVVGQAAREWSTRAPGERRDAYLAQLARYFGEEARQPIAFVDQDWSVEAWTRGCPTGILPPGGMTAAGRALREPCGRVHWAGTETATEYTGYMEGALQSGERAAAEVVRGM
jgi:monoamine oxidase